MSALLQPLIGVSVGECARQLGVDSVAVQQAIRAGRCEAFADGSVDVDAVREGMSMSADPFNGGKREAGVFGVLPLGTPVDPVAAPAAKAPHPHAAIVAARTITEQSKAEREQIELAKLKGLVAEIAPMTSAIYDAMVSTRMELMALPDRLTSLVTPETDAGKVHAMIEAEVLRVCEKLRDRLQLQILQHASLVTAP
jgi:hypothetical protein